jgi:DNA adenine methylase
MKTFIRRLGNKSRILKYIIPRIPSFSGTYIEPFLGTGAVYLHLLPKKGILNDINKDIISIWKLVKSNPEYLLKEIDSFKKWFLPLSNEEKLKRCKEIVSKLHTFPKDKRTVMYLLMIYCSYNASLEQNGELSFTSLSRQLYSNNSAHIFTETYKEKIKQLSSILKNVKIYPKDYSEVIAKAKEGDFVFLDPPYVKERKYCFKYNVKELLFSITKLKAELELLTSKKVKWMMTQIDTKEVRELFKSYNFFEYHNKNGFLGVVLKKELIITNYTFPE